MANDFVTVKTAKTTWSITAFITGLLWLFALIASIISQGILQVIFSKDITMLVYVHKLLLRRLNNT